MPENNQIKPIHTKDNTRKEVLFGITIFKKKFVYSIIISLGILSSLIALGITIYFEFIDRKVCFIPIMIALIIIFILTALKYRYKKL
ncbi:hypothetical protein D3C85_551510 [compost metagenome]